MNPEHPWAKLGEELGAEVYPGWTGGAPVLQLSVGDTLVTADTMPAQAGGYRTQVRAVYPGRESFRFSIRSARISTELSKLFFGTQDILVGDKSFDRRFVVRGNDEARTRALFGRPSVLEILKGYWNMTLTAGPLSPWREGYLRGDVDGFDLVGFRSASSLSADRLRRVFELFQEILAELGLAGGEGDPDDVGRLVARLRSPGGTISQGHIVLWDGDTPRREAAERMGELQAPEAVEALVESLSDTDGALRLTVAEALVECLPDRDDALRSTGAEALVESLSDPEAALRLAAVEALARIGDPRTVPSLAGLLGDQARVEGTVIAVGAAKALQALGAGDLVDGVHQALQGRAAALRDCVYRYRAAKPVARAMTAVMEGSDLSAVEAAGRILGWLGTTEVLPELRRIHRATGWDRGREACRKAIAAIEAMPSLPRPADRPEAAYHEGLPRVAGAPAPDRGGLPRAVNHDAAANHGGAAKQDGAVNQDVAVNQDGDEP